MLKGWQLSLKMKVIQGSDTIKNGMGAKMP